MSLEDFKLRRMKLIRFSKYQYLVMILIFVLGVIASISLFPFLQTQAATKVSGIDVSHWQGSINWNSVYSSGYRFAFVKATEGTTYVDPEFTTNMQNGKAAGLYMGAYHFARPSSNSPEAEADHFVNVAGPYIKNGYLRPVLDLETGTSLGWSGLSDWANRWMQRVLQLTGVEPILYVSTYYASNLQFYLTSYDLWIAHWTYDPNKSPNTGKWSTWMFWQYSDKGTVSGISGYVDLDVFNGDLSALVSQAVIGGGGNGGTTYSHYLVFEVTASVLNVRTGPGTSYSKIGTVRAGQQYVAIDAVQSGSLTWYKFWFDGAERWCAATGYTKVVPFANVVKVTAGTLNVRSGPSTAYSIIGQVHSGEMYVKYSSSGSWYKIWFKGSSSAWVHSAYVISQPVPADNYFVFEVTASVLNVRTGPSTGYGKVGTIRAGQQYVVVDVVQSGGLTWYKFWFDGTARWCAATGYTKVVPFTDVFEVTASALNVRSGPSTSYSIIGVIHSGELYVKYGISGNWYHFWFKGVTNAWCHSGYVKSVS